MDQPQLAAQVRHTKGKQAAKKLRKSKKIPAIFYGPKSEPVMLTLDYPELERVLKQSTGENVILDLNVQSDKGTETKKVMLKELLVDPVKDTYLHVDFYEISMDKEITVSVPIRLINTPAGVTKGGVLQNIRRELEISGLPDKIVDSLEIDVAELEIGDAVHVRDIVLPSGLLTSEDEALTVAVVAAPTVVPEIEEEEVEEVVEEEAAEEEEKAEDTE